VSSPRTPSRPFPDRREAEADSVREGERDVETFADQLGARRRLVNVSRRDLRRGIGQRVELGRRVAGRDPVRHVAFRG
jgi:hypothetical protein